MIQAAKRRKNAAYGGSQYKMMRLEFLSAK
jgi:hypothetical protein